MGNGSILAARILTWTSTTTNVDDTQQTHRKFPYFELQRQRNPLISDFVADYLVLQVLRISKVLVKKVGILGKGEKEKGRKIQV